VAEIPGLIRTIEDIKEEAREVDAIAIESDTRQSRCSHDARFVKFSIADFTLVGCGRSWL